MEIQKDDGRGLEPAADKPERNWIPLVISGVVVAAIVAAGLMLSGRPRRADVVTPISTPVDSYSSSLPISNLVMSESTNLAGGKVTYIDGHVENTGHRTITGITVQVLFQSYTHEVAQNETTRLRLIRMREPYVDTEPIASDPLKPGSGHDFRLIFDRVSPDWAGAVPEIRILHVESNP